MLWAWFDRNAGPLPVRMRSFRPVGPAALVLTALVAVLAPSLPPELRYGPLLVSVLLLGLPHGAVDHVAVAGAFRDHLADGAASASPPDGFAEGLLSPARPLGRALRSVALLYASTGGAYLLLWAGAPVLAAAVFILLTWGHWGQGDLYHLLASGSGAHLDTRGKRAVTLFVRGGLPMLVPLLAFPATYRRVVAALAGVVVATPALPSWPFAPRTRLVLGVAFGLITLLSLGWGRLGIPSSARQAWRVDAAETALLWAFFLLVPPILAIGVYFTFWHSLRHVRRVVALDAGEGVPDAIRPGATDAVAALDRPALWRFTRTALPNTVGALLLFGAIYAVSATRGSLLAVLAAYLVAIAVLTLPHTAVVTWLDARQGVWRTDGAD